MYWRIRLSAKDCKCSLEIFLPSPAAWPAKMGGQGRRPTPSTRADEALDRGLALPVETSTIALCAKVPLYEPHDARLGRGHDRRCDGWFR